MARKTKKNMTPKLRFPEFREAPRWDTLRLEDACESVTQGGTPSTTNSDYWNGSVNWITPAEMGKSNDPFVVSTERKITEAGLVNCSSPLLPSKSVIISTRAPIGHLAINRCPMALNQGCKGLIPKQDTDYFFLYSSLLSSTSRLQDLGAGNTFKELSSSALKNFEIPVPSIAEQQKIAACLGSLDELIAAAGRKLTALRDHKQGLMQQLFPQPGQSQPQLRFPEFRDQPGWDVKPLGKICDKIMDGTHFSPKSKDGPRPYLTSKNIRTGYLDLSTVTFISEQEHRAIYKRCPVQLNDVLLTKDGASTGNCALNTLDYEFSLLSSVAVIRGNSERLDQRFLYQTIASDRMQQLIVGSMSGQAITRITLTKLGEYPIAFPMLPEQQKIADCLTALDTQITAQAEQIESLKTHKRGLMQQLFPSPQNSCE